MWKQSKSILLSFKQIFNKHNNVCLSIYQPAVLLLVGIRDDDSVPIRKETCGCQVASCSSNVSKGNVSLATSSSIAVLLLLVCIGNYYNSELESRKYQNSRRFNAPQSIYYSIT